MKIEKWVQDLLEHSRRYTKAWDYFITSNDAYAAGYRAARLEAGLPNLGKEIIEVPDLVDGAHQLSVATFKKNKKENYALPFKELVVTYIPMVEFKEVRVVEDSEGNISFQGTGQRVKVKEHIGFIEE